MAASRSDGLFAGVFGRGRASGEVDDLAWLQAMLDVEAALARACARAHLIPPAAAEAIAGACRAERFDIAAIGRAAAAGGNPVIPLVQALRNAVAADVAEHVHHGATSQDILDSAAMLVARRSLASILRDSATAAQACAELARTHRDAPQIGRTLLQQAVPFTFGLKAAGWMTGIDEARTMLAVVARDGPAVQLGGAVGTQDAYAGHGQAVTGAVAAELGLAEPVLPWHTTRVRPAALAGALALLTGVLGKAARDVTLLAQDEVGEVREAAGSPGRGASSAMAHKRNPVAAVSVIACAQRMPGLVSTIHAAMLQEHERAAGAWHSEWETLADLLRLAGSAAVWSCEMFTGLEVDTERMQINLMAAAERHGLHMQPAVAAAGTLVDRALAAHRAMAA